jgi:hypothetical protein
MRWLEKAVVQRCLGAAQFLGRSIDCFFYWDILDQHGTPSTHPIRVLLERLGRRGFAVGYQGSFGTEGIHGWLCPAESKALADHLFRLKLPDYEYSFNAMESFKEIRNIFEGRVSGKEFLWPSYRHPSASFEELSLSYVRTVCRLAEREGKVSFGAMTSPEPEVINLVVLSSVPSAGPFQVDLAREEHEHFSAN